MTASTNQQQGRILTFATLPEGRVDTAVEQLYLDNNWLTPTSTPTS